MGVCPDAAPDFVDVLDVVLEDDFLVVDDFVVVVDDVDELVLLEVLPAVMVTAMNLTSSDERSVVLVQVVVEPPSISSAVVTRDAAPVYTWVHEAFVVPSKPH